MQQCITLAEAYELFMLDGASRGFTRDTLRFYRDRLGIVLRRCSGQGIATVQEITATSIKLYLAGMQQRDLSSHYVHSHARAIRTLCRLRRTMAIHSLRNGVNIHLLARMLGHSDIHILKQYLEIVQADVATAAKRSGVVDNLK